jgi:hypothetical protein
MKPKKIDIKLSLKRQTIANLNGRAMGHVKGGCLKTGVNSGCQISYTCLLETCRTNCVVSCEGPTCQGTYPDCPCPMPRE